MDQENLNLTVSCSPHVHAPDGTRDIMLDVLIGLIPAMLGAIFMATDYATSPVTKGGQIVYGIGCGLITMFIRYFGSYAEGVSYAILIMNIAVLLLDKIGVPKRFGYVKPGKEAAK